MSSCFCRPSAEHLFIAAAPRCQIFISHYSSRYLQQQLGIGLEVWKRFPDFGRNLHAQRLIPQLLRISSLTRMQSNDKHPSGVAHCAHISRGFEIMSGKDLENSFKAVMSCSEDGAPPTLLLLFLHHLEGKCSAVFVASCF